MKLTAQGRFRRYEKLRGHCTLDRIDHFLDSNLDQYVFNVETFSHGRGTSPRGALQPRFEACTRFTWRFRAHGNANLLPQEQ
jgi:hypothetical protein